MNSSKLCLALLLAGGTLAARAAVKDHTTEATGTAVAASADPAAVVMLASADPSVSPMRLGVAAIEAKPESAGVEESLPELPTASTQAFLLRKVLGNVSELSAARPQAAPIAGAATLPNSPGVSLIQSSPLAGAARRIGAERFNTEDGSSADAFAICYRLSQRSSVQVIPGDPAPVKMPVTTMANNMGVTVGMVLRLSKRP